MRQLTAHDAQFLDMEQDHSAPNFSVLTILDPSTAPGGTLDAGRVSGLLGERLHLMPPFTWKLAEVPFGLARPYWTEDASFDLGFHIRERSIPAGGDERALTDLVAELVSRPLDRTRPLWELYVLNGLPDGRVALLTKMHHAAVDGVSANQLVSVLFDDSPEAPEAAPAERRPGSSTGSAPTELEMLSRGLLGVALQPLRALRWMADAARQARADAQQSSDPPQKPPAPQSAGDVLQGPLARPPRTRFNDRISGDRVVALAELPLDEVKAIKDAMGLTVNDVVMAICAGALRAWLLERGELPDVPLVAAVPVSVRTPEQEGTFGNRVSAMFVALPTDEPDPRRRLERAHEVMRRAKEIHGAIPVHLFQELAELTPAALNARAGRLVLRLADPKRPAYNCVISNIPGSPVPLYCGGARLVAQYPVSAIVDGMGLNITLMSYSGQLHFGVVMDREHHDDAWPLADALRSALDTYTRTLAAEPTSPGSD